MIILYLDFILSLLCTLFQFIVRYSASIDLIPGKEENVCTLFRFEIVLYSMYVNLGGICTLLLATPNLSPVGQNHGSVQIIEGLFD